MIDFLTTNYQIITSFSAIFVSLLAVVIGYLQLKSSQEHQELSVYPNLTSEVTISKINDKDTELSYVFKIELVNYGVGPAIVEYLKVVVGNKNVKNWTSMIKEMKIYMGSEKYVPIDINSSSQLGNRSMIPAGSRKTLLLLESKIEEDGKNLIEEMLNDVKSMPIDFETCYSSIYGKKWIEKKGHTKKLKSWEKLDSTNKFSFST